nr:RidA family protein [Mesorhizobium sp. B2-3-11]
MPVLSAAVRALGVPLSLVTKAAGLVFVSGTPPLDLLTGKLVKGDIEVQTDASLKALKHCLEAAGTSLDNVVMVRIYAVNSGFYNAINRVYARYSPKTRHHGHLCRWRPGRWSLISRSSAWRLGEGASEPNLAKGYQLDISRFKRPAAPPHHGSMAIDFLLQFPSIIDF